MCKFDRYHSQKTYSPEYVETCLFLQFFHHFNKEINVT